MIRAQCLEHHARDSFIFSIYSSEISTQPLVIAVGLESGLKHVIKTPMRHLFNQAHRNNTTTAILLVLLLCLFAASSLSADLVLRSWGRLTKTEDDDDDTNKVVEKKEKKKEKKCSRAQGG